MTKLSIEERNYVQGMSPACRTFPLPTSDFAGAAQPMTQMCPTRPILQNPKTSHVAAEPPCTINYTRHPMFLGKCLEARGRTSGANWLEGGWFDGVPGDGRGHPLVETKTFFLSN
ncbi:hypothetical protein RUM44_002117 [Polyplax serrata]|uniref:Uncharacterized protein n=1 Tax=Polyplax serrata TaxID=468196 RepID=A0ABR1ALY3_POLSC